MIIDYEMSSYERQQLKKKDKEMQEQLKNENPPSEDINLPSNAEEIIEDSEGTNPDISSYSEDEKNIYDKLNSFTSEELKDTVVSLGTSYDEAIKALADGYELIEDIRQTLQNPSEVRKLLDDMGYSVKDIYPEYHSKVSSFNGKLLNQSLNGAFEKCILHKVSSLKKNNPNDIFIKIVSNKDIMPEYKKDFISALFDSEDFNSVMDFFDKDDYNTDDLDNYVFSKFSDDKDSLYNKIKNMHAVRFVDLGNNNDNNNNKPSIFDDMKKLNLKIGD